MARARLRGGHVQGRQRALPAGDRRRGLDRHRDATALKRRGPAAASSLKRAGSIARRARPATVVRSGGMPQPVLTPAIREEIARLERADIMVGIPSFKNATTIGYVVRAAQ